MRNAAAAAPDKAQRKYGLWLLRPTRYRDGNRVLGIERSATG